MTYVAKPEMQLSWPEVFNDPYMDYHPDMPALQRRGVALADQLAGWGNCMAGGKPPEGFGQAMVALSKFTGVTTLEKALKATVEWQAEWKETTT